MRKAHIKIDRIVRKCWECPFLTTSYNPNRTIVDEWGNPFPVEEFYCTYHDENEENPVAHCMDESIALNSIPDWCPFLEEIEDEGTH